jgi:hypothetical protein
MKRMAVANEDTPLDLPEKPEPQNEAFFALRLVGTGLVVVGLIGRSMHWPYANELLMSGLVTWSAWNLLLLIRGRRKKRWEQFYALGRLSLAAALFLQVFLYSRYSLVSFGIAALFFVAGVVASMRDQ